MPIGSNFDDFLQDQGYLNDVDAAATKRVIAWKLQQPLEDKNPDKD